jgi:uncharacterized protein YvpB
MNKGWSAILFFLVLGTFCLFRIPVARADGLPDSADIRDVTGRRVEGHPQSYPLSCESRSAVDWAAYFGVSIKERKFLNSLPRSDNPDLGFVGQPNSSWGNVPPQSYGVHAEPVAGLLREFGLDAQAHSDMTWEELQAEIAAGRPVIVWVIGEMWPGTRIKYVAPDGQAARVARFEHTMILVAYSPKTVKAVDAYTGRTSTFSRQAFLTSWETLGRMVVVMAEPKPAKIIDPATAPYKGYLTLLLNRVEVYTPADLRTTAAGLSGLQVGYSIYLPEVSLPDRPLVRYRMHPGR